MTSDADADADTACDSRQIGIITTPDNPSTPQEAGPRPIISAQATLPSTELPGSPLDLDQSFETEANDDRQATMVIPSSLTPPPSTQIAALREAKRSFSQSQKSVLCSPPATILQALRNRDVGSDYTPPASRQLLDASPDELRSMLQTCIADQQKLKMETAHHKLQYNLLSLQAEEDAKRSAVEHDMVRREVDALRVAEHSRQAKREISTASDPAHAKYLRMKLWYEAAMEENEALHRRLKVAKRVIQQKEEENISLAEERDMLLTRIRENREHFHMLCSPGGIFYSAMPTKQYSDSTPQQHRALQGAQQHTPRPAQKEDASGRDHGLSALLQAMSQGQDHNTSAPSTPITGHRAVQRHPGRHSRNAQSMSSLPTTPLNRSRDRDGGLLPSADLVAQTEPRYQYSHQQYGPTMLTSERDRRRKSRESTISAEDNEELARQALESVEGFRSFAHDMSRGEPSMQAFHQQRRNAGDEEDEEVFGSQASQAATEMLRHHHHHHHHRHPKTFGVSSPAETHDGSPVSAEHSAQMQAKLLSSSCGGVMDKDKRKFAGNYAAVDDVRCEHGSPTKKARTGVLSDMQRIGLGIQYGR